MLHYGYLDEHKPLLRAFHFEKRPQDSTQPECFIRRAVCPGVGNWLKYHCESSARMLFQIITLLSLAPFVLSATSNQSWNRKRKIVPGGYIVEFEDITSIASADVSYSHIVYGVASG